MTDEKWSYKEIKTFLKKFQNYPCLWDASSKEYLSKYSRDQAIHELTKRLNDEGILGTPDYVKKKIKSLRDTYRKELIKVQKSKKCGGAASKVYKPKLAWFSAADEFWHRSLVGKDPSSISNYELLSVLDSEDEEATSRLKMQPQPITRFKQLKPKPPTRLQNVVNKLPKVAELCNSDGEDQYDTFGKHIASQLRQLPVKNFILLQSTIQNMITDERVAHLDAIAGSTISQSISIEDDGEKDEFEEEEKLDSDLEY